MTFLGCVQQLLSQLESQNCSFSGLEVHTDHSAVTGSQEADTLLCFVLEEACCGSLLLRKVSILAPRMTTVSLEV